MVFKGLHTSVQDACTMPSMDHRGLFTGFAGHYWLTGRELPGRTQSCVHPFFPGYAAKRENVYVSLRPLFPLQIRQLAVAEAAGTVLGAD